MSGRRLRQAVQEVSYKWNNIPMHFYLEKKRIPYPYDLIPFKLIFAKMIRVLHFLKVKAGSEYEILMT